MKFKTVFLICIALAAALIAWLSLGKGRIAGTQIEIGPRVADSSGRKVADYKVFLNLTKTGDEELDAYINEIKEGWHPGSATMLIEMTQTAKFHKSRKRIFEALEEKTGQQFGNKGNLWVDWIWKQEYEPHPQYSQFKHDLYHRADNRFTEYFVDSDNPIIRLDEIRWGGVQRDGIPPLDKPEMIAANEADYLDDSNVAFGVSINGDHRCYPKRILAWHEMFKDTIGGVSVCGAY